MSGSSSVPSVAWTANGFVAPDESAILEGVQADQNAAFGGNLNPALDTPQGQLASSLTAVIAEKNSQFLKFQTQVDPAYAEGRMQDGIARIYFLTRKPATSTVVSCTCMGLAGVVIPAGALAQDLNGNLYAAVQAATIPNSGTVTMDFAAVTPGPNPCLAGALNAIYQAIPGWDSITNPADGVLGSNVESRAEFETRRAQSVAKNSQGAIGSVLGQVAQVDGVIDFYGYDNGLGTSHSIGSVSIAAHSIYVAVEGGTDADVATAIMQKKGPGAGMTGNTTVTVYDDNPLYSSPIPYSITFERPAALPILFAVTLKNSAQVPSNVSDLVKAAIINAFTGGDGGARARIGDTVYASRFYTPVASLGSWAHIVQILIGTATATLNSVSVEINQVPTISDTDITVTLV